jgi:hypothetical protein
MQELMPLAFRTFITTSHHFCHKVILCQPHCIYRIRAYYVADAAPQ